MPLSNQYGIDLGNIYSTASSLKTAKQLQEMRQSEIDKDKAAQSAEQEYLKKARPGTTATSVAQQTEFDKLDAATKKIKLDEAQKTIEKHGKVAIFASKLPVDQQAQYIQQYVSTLPEEEQTAFQQKYGHDDISQQIPHIINDLMTTDQLIEEQKAKLKHENALEEIGVKGAIRYGEKELETTAAQKRAETRAESDIKREGIKQTGETSREVAKGRNQYKPKLLDYEIKTVVDPKTGNKSVVRINHYDDGSSSQTQATKPTTKPTTAPSKGSTYNPKDVVRYGTKNGRKVAQMKDGSVIYVK